ncbi:MAG TPA: DUF86 domain-containing protein [Gammaproteobacteria bacterium]|nr:DUF86 domain-containing protein [Gammaproteobacteria bacterium]
MKRIEDRRAVSAEALRENADLQDILSLNLTRAVQLCVDIASHVLTDTEQAAPQTMGEAFDLLAAEGTISDALCKRMRAAVGFRNIAVHSYQAIDWEIVHAITHQGLEDFRSFAARIASMLGRTS